jgi:HD-GYP domain-containing protein (c-di-GMP phosphodiesterase class II)
LDKENVKVDFNKFIASVSLALDLAEGSVFHDYNVKSTDLDSGISLDYSSHNFVLHSKKATLVSLYLANKLSLADERLNNIYIASFLHDIGAVDAFSVSHTNIQYMLEHCDFGADILKKLPIDSSISEFVRLHHENYNGSGPKGLSHGQIPLEAQIIHLADMFELVFNNDRASHNQREIILRWMRTQKKKMFDPYLVDALCEIAEAERFWLDLLNIGTNPDILDRLKPKLGSSMSILQLTDISEVFAAIIDKKSRFTQLHSAGLADYTQKFAKLYGFDNQKTAKLKIAGLLHDIGKLSVPNSILDKPGRLSPEEFTVIKSHTYYTRLILSKIDNFDEICDWAANHHETLRGTGYPDRLDGEKLSLESRIMAVCDIYQALTENRPYRQPMSKDSAIKIIDNMAASGDIDVSVVKNLKEIV